MKKFAAAVLALSASTAAFARPVPAPQDMLPEVEFAQRLGETLPADAAVRDEAGRATSFGDALAGRPSIVAFVYYECPMLCTEVLNGVVRALRAVRLTPGRDFTVVALSFNARETPELAARKKAAYLRSYGKPCPPDGWRFLTAEQASIDRLTSAAGFRYKPLPDGAGFAHAAGILVVTPEGRIARVFYGVDYSARDLKLALIDAAGRRVGSPIDRLLLLCYHYDPVTGKYGFVITRVLRAAAAATALALGAFVFFSLRRERTARGA